MEDGKISKPKATFVVQTRYGEHSTWQGTINWVEEHREQTFRSALELIMMIDSATKEAGIQEERSE